MPARCVPCLRTLAPGYILVAKTDPPMISVIGAIAARMRGAQMVNWLQDLFPEVAAAAGIRSAKGLPGKLLRGPGLVIAPRERQHRHRPAHARILVERASIRRRSR